MWPMRKLDDFLKSYGVHLYPYQRKLLEMIASGKRIYTIFPRPRERDEVNELLFELHRQALVLEEAERRLNEGENDV